jgi:hypothetical protein
MLTDIIEDTQLFMLSTWNSVVDAVSPQPAKREAIRVGMSKLNLARAKYREVDSLLNQEAQQLDVNHKEERKLLAEKQKVEKESMKSRHSETRTQAREGVRQVRAMVLSDIAGWQQPTVPSKALAS